MISDDSVLNGITEKIIGCAIEVHRTLGAGLLESVYRDCMLIEMSHRGLCVESERRVPLLYKGERLSRGLTLDLLVDQSVVVELKAVECLQPVHSSQVITYLKVTGCPVGLLCNFNVTAMRAGIKRLVHPERYQKKFPS